MNCAIFCLLAFCALGSSQKAVREVSVDTKTVPLYVPCLDELRTVLTKELSKNYAEVSVEVVDCPDLKEAPFNLAASGLGGNPAILDMGGPLAHHDIENVPYPLDTLAYLTSARKEGFLLGAAQGPANYPIGMNEIVVNVVLNSPASDPGSIATVSNEENNKVSLYRFPGNETTISFVGNVLLSEGKPGKVLQIHVRKRIGEMSAFPDYIQKILSKHYQNQLVGLGGTFVSKVGVVRHHVLPAPNTGHKFIYYNMSAPLISAGVILSAETDLQFSPYHFHSYSEQNKDGGHYHYDVTPDQIEYLGYFTTAKMASRVICQDSDFSAVSEGSKELNAERVKMPH